MLKTKGFSINHKSDLKHGGSKKPLASLIFILLIITSLSAGNVLADASAASPGQEENGENLTVQHETSTDEELGNSVKEEADSGKIEIITIPNGSEIYINDVLRGTTPARLTNVPPGFYEVVLKQEGYDDVFERVLVRAGETFEISKKLSFKEGVCSISSEPGGARVYFDGKYKGITPVAFHADEGTHSLKMKKTGYRTFSKEVDVSYDEPFVLKEELHLSALVYMAAALVLLAGVVFIKKKPVIPELKIPTGRGLLEKYEKKFETALKREKKKMGWKKPAFGEKESSGQLKTAVEPDKPLELEKDTEPDKLVELEKISKPEFGYTIKKKEKD